MTDSEASVTTQLYHLFDQLPRYRFGDLPARTNELPDSGLYLCFEDGQTVRMGQRTFDRIVRIGTHRIDHRLPTRLRKHYGNVHNLGGNHSDSVFRMHLGGALMSQADPDDPRLTDWLQKDGPNIAQVEEWVSRTIRTKFSFCCFQIDSKEERLSLESKLISTLAQCPLGRSAGDWLGSFAASSAIRRTGLWNIQHVDGIPMRSDDLPKLESLVGAEVRSRGAR